MAQIFFVLSLNNELIYLNTTYVDLEFCPQKFIRANIINIFKKWKIAM